MTLRALGLATLIVTLSGSAAFAACPAPVAGETPEAIRANQQRLVCLQQQLVQSGDRSAQQFEIDQIGRDIDRIDLQRRFDSLNFNPPMPPPTQF